MELDTLLEEAKIAIRSMDWYQLGYIMGKIDINQKFNRIDAAESIRCIKYFKDPEVGNVKVPLDKWDDYTLGYGKAWNLSNTEIEKDLQFTKDVIKNILKRELNKKAYPSGYADRITQAPHDVSKWANTMSKIYDLKNQGYGFNDSLDFLTKEWDIHEKDDFKNWMAFYQSDSHKAYKTAQQIPLDILKATLPTRAPDFKEYPTIQDTTVDQKAEIDRKIKSIISRLSAAERLATDPTVQKELQSRLDIGLRKWLEELHAVKRQVQLAPIKNIKSTILEDLIIKRANILEKQGFVKAAKLFEKLAQIDNHDKTPSVTPATPLKTVTPPVTQAPGPDASQQDEEVINALIKGLNPSDNDDNDDNDNDNNNIVDVEEDPIFDMKLKATVAPFYRTIKAQEVPQNLNALPQEPQEIVQETPEQEVPAEVEVVEDNKQPLTTNDIFEAALANITINDVINELEAIANIFRTREIPRRLSKVDLMMDKLDMSTFFPALAEAASKSLEGNQYSLIRVEEILSKLRGAVQTPAKDIINLSNAAPVVEDTQLAGIKNKLTEQSNLDKLRKEKRKQDELEKALAPEEPKPQAQQPQITNVQEDLSQPIQTQKPIAATPVR